MKTQLTVRGNVATAPRRVVTDTGIVISEFRLAATERFFNRQTEQWEDGNTSWYTVSAFRQLAENIFRSFTVGDPVTVTGKVSIKQWTSKDETKRGTTAEIVADTAGHDLMRGFTEFTRHTKNSPRVVEETPADSPLVDHGWEEAEPMTA
ncbi:MAG: single-stranded DNA-binding protein [Micrococcaceae bacterium]|nr:single-stranded DNA-binding protein [Micrococcaceae bacterium]